MLKNQLNITQLNFCQQVPLNKNNNNNDQTKPQQLNNKTIKSKQKQQQYKISETTATQPTVYDTFSYSFYNWPSKFWAIIGAIYIFNL